MQKSKWNKGCWGSTNLRLLKLYRKRKEIWENVSTPVKDKMRRDGEKAINNFLKWGET